MLILLYAIFIVCGGIMANWKFRRRVIAFFMIIFIISLILGYRYITQTTPASIDAYVMLEDSVEINVVETINYIAFHPSDNNLKVGFIYYPGDNVEEESGAILCRSLAEEGYLTVIAKMPFDWALFKVNAADSIFEAFPEIDRWYLSGYSLGGTAACVYTYNNIEKIEGLILMAAHSSIASDMSDFELPVVSLYASEDGITTVKELEDSMEYLPADTEYILIEGGNHSQFTALDIPLLKGDNEALITKNKQHSLIKKNIIEFLHSIE